MRKAERSRLAVTPGFEMVYKFTVSKANDAKKL
jgi:hypothetical protein